jgi:hypothetical protein
MGRARHPKTIAFMERCKATLAEIQPATVRAVAYKRFVAKDPMVPSMDQRHVRKVSAALKWGREEGHIPWAWVVDETRRVEGWRTWRDPEEYAEEVADGYHKDRWLDQDYHIIVVSEKSTVAGMLRPVLRRYGVDFLSVHGYNSTTSAYNLASWSTSLALDGRQLVLLYCGDHDPSGRHMSDVDLPGRINDRYEGLAAIRRIALTEEDCTDALPEHHADEKKDDPRYPWFLRTHGHRCWELDALDPNVLRERVGDAVREYIDVDKWNRADVAERAQIASLKQVLGEWQGLFSS